MQNTISYISPCAKAPLILLPTIRPESAFAPALPLPVNALTLYVDDAPLNTTCPLAFPSLVVLGPITFPANIVHTLPASDRITCRVTDPSIIEKFGFVVVVGFTANRIVFGCEIDTDAAASTFAVPSNRSADFPLAIPVLNVGRAVPLAVRLFVPGLALLVHVPTGSPLEYTAGSPCALYQL